MGLRLGKALEAMVRGEKSNGKLWMGSHWLLYIKMGKELWGGI